MDYLQLIGAAITGGATLGAIVAGFFAARQKSRVLLLQEIAGDYEKRVKQLEDDRDSLQKTVDGQTQEIRQLKAEKTLPLTKLTELIIAQHAENQESIMRLTSAIVAATHIAAPKSKRKGEKA